MRQTRATTVRSWSCSSVSRTPQQMCVHIPYLCVDVGVCVWDRASWDPHDMLWTILTWTTVQCVTYTVILLSETLHLQANSLHLRRSATWLCFFYVHLKSTKQTNKQKEKRKCCQTCPLHAFPARGSLWHNAPLTVHYQVPSLGRCQWSRLYHTPS